MRHAEPAVLTAELLRHWPLPAPSEDGTKHDRGTVHVIGGEDSTPGAVILAGLAALRVGAGRLTITTTSGTATQVAVAVPEAMVLAGRTGSGALVGVAEASCDCVVLGPGMTDADVDVVASAVASREEGSLVLDAGALKVLPAELPRATVLTPNAAELKKLCPSEGSIETSATYLSAERRVVVATQGWVAAPDGRLWRQDNGSVALATSGSGDVLAGIIGGLLARGASPEQAACWGLFVHAEAAKRLAPTRGELGVLARELLDELPQAVAGVQRGRG